MKVDINVLTTLLLANGIGVYGLSPLNDLNEIRGVSPVDQIKYKPDSHHRWACLNHPEITIPFDAINDDYCDCPDGSDEPDTAACAGLPSGQLKTSFWCPNVGFRGQYLPSHRVNDGICDYEICCDGSDEWMGVGGVVCENRCEEMKRDWQTRMKAESEGLKRGLAIRADRVCETELKLKAVEDDIAKIERRLKKLEDMTTKSSESSLLEPSSWCQKVRDQYEGLQDHIRFLESHSDEPAYPQTEIDWSKCHQTTETSWINTILDQIPGLIHDPIMNAFSRFQQWLIDHEYLEEPSLSSTGVSARETARIQQSITELQATLIAKRNLLLPTRDLGRDKIFYPYALGTEISAVRNRSHNQSPPEVEQCVTTWMTGYEYKVCLLDSVHQSGNGHDSVLGKFESFAEVDLTRDPVTGLVRGLPRLTPEQVSDGLTIVGGECKIEMKFEGGTKCWEGPERRTDVEIFCGEKEGILMVKEAEKCSYLIQMVSPLACRGVVDEVETELMHDEL